MMGWFKRLFGADEPSRPAATEFPKSEYSAYWETFVDPATFEWHVRIMSRSQGGGLLEEKHGHASTLEASKRRSKEWARKAMRRYRREGV